VNDSDSVTIGGARNRLVLERGSTGPSDSDPRRRAVWSLAAELHAEGLTARTNIHLGPEGVEARLDEFFAGLAADWRGWDGIRSWEGTEGRLELFCVHDGIAHAQVELMLHHLSPALPNDPSVLPLPTPRRSELRLAEREVRQHAAAGIASAKTFAATNDVGVEGEADFGRDGA
jgi:hypothetical protein